MNLSIERRFVLPILLATIALIFSIVLTPAATAKLFDGPVDRLPLQERVDLRKGKSILNGAQGNYTGRVLITASTDVVWQVLTDYNNFPRFLPDVTESKLLETKGNRKVFEQINQVKTFIFSTKAKVRIAVNEFYPSQIAFQLVNGDLDSLDGVWLLEPVSPYPSAPSDRVLITHKVIVQPNGNTTRGIFYDIYEKTLEATLDAIKIEAEERSARSIDNLSLLPYNYT
jgi:ribosome-associated toxin RatA of RatAB toxin-antitoxin module